MIPRHYGIRTERYKLIHFYQFGNEWEMYDLKEDPDELTNIYGKGGREKLQTDLRKQLVDIRRHYDDNTDVSEKPAAWKKQVRP
jgi:arylsulfatase A-like enzyme